MWINWISDNLKRDFITEDFLQMQECQTCQINKKNVQLNLNFKWTIINMYYNYVSMSYYAYNEAHKYIVYFKSKLSVY